MGAQLTREPLTPLPMAEKGMINYHETFEVDGDLLDLSDEAIVVHGGLSLLPITGSPRRVCPERTRCGARAPARLHR